MKLVSNQTSRFHDGLFEDMIWNARNVLYVHLQRMDQDFLTLGEHKATPISHYLHMYIPVMK